MHRIMSEVDAVNNTGKGEGFWLWSVNTMWFETKTVSSNSPLVICETSGLPTRPGASVAVLLTCYIDGTRPPKPVLTRNKFLVPPSVCRAPADDWLLYQKTGNVIATHDERNVGTSADEARIPPLEHQCLRPGRAVIVFFVALSSSFFVPLHWISRPLGICELPPYQGWFHGCRAAMAPSRALACALAACNDGRRLCRARQGGRQRRMQRRPSAIVTCALRVLALRSNS